MNERDYINATNITRLRAALHLLRDVMPNEDTSEELARLARCTVARLAIHLESNMARVRGDEGEWPVGVCGRVVEVGCTNHVEHDEDCSV